MPLTPMQIHEAILEAYKSSLKNYEETPQELKDHVRIAKPVAPALPVQPSPIHGFSHSGRVSFAQKYGRRIIRR